MIAQAACGVVGAEDPIFDIGAEARIFRRRTGRKKHLADVQRFKRGLDVQKFHLRGAELSRSYVGVCKAGAIRRREAGHDGSKEVVLVGTEHRGVHRCTRCNDAGHFAPYELGCGRRHFHLIADGDAITLLRQAGDIVFGRVKGHAAHGDRLTLLFVARGQRDLKFPGGSDGVFVKELVEIPEPEHQQGAGHLLLDAMVLPHERRGGRRLRRHGNYSLWLTGVSKCRGDLVLHVALTRRCRVI